MSNDHALSCGGAGSEMVFVAAVQPGETIDVGMHDTTYDSMHETKWGGDCPGLNVVQCSDDPDTARHLWTNDQGSEQNVYFTVDAVDAGVVGEFTVTWDIGVVEDNTEDGWAFNGGQWFTAPDVNWSCNQLCDSLGMSFDEAATQHEGNQAGAHFWPDKDSSVGNWVDIECSSTDNNANWGANGGSPNADWTHSACHVNCACLGGGGGD